MELDELRRRWQQAAAAEAPAASDAALSLQLLERGSRSAVAKLRRNAVMELSFTVVLLLLSGGALIYLKEAQSQAMMIWLIILCLGSIISYHRHLLRGVRSLPDADAPVREQLTQQLNDVRKTMRGSYQSALWTLPVSFGIPLCFGLNRLLSNYSGKLFWMQLGILLLSTIGIGFFAYFGMRAFGRQYLQTLYGQHLDQLEASLAELEEPAMN